MKTTGTQSMKTMSTRTSDGTGSSDDYWIGMPSPRMKMKMKMGGYEEEMAVAAGWPYDEQDDAQ